MPNRIIRREPMLGKGDLLGNSYIGVFCVANESLTLVPISASEELVERVAGTVGTEIVKASVDGATVLGSLITMNSYGTLVSDFATNSEIEVMGGDATVKRLKHKLNAVGNNVLANDNGALVHPSYDDEIIKFISDTLGVPVERGTVAGFRTVGSAAVATNKGAICHPHASDYEKELLKTTLGVEVSIATANYGTGLLGACMIANSKGALVGETSTPIELGKIEEGLKLY